MASNRTIFNAGRINWDESQIKILLAGPTGEVAQDIQRRARSVQRRAQTNAPFRTGELRSSISVNTSYPATGAVAEITASAPHALYVEFGRRAVTPTNKSVLHWQGDTGPVFANSVRPVNAVHFMRDALDAVED